MSLLVRIVEGDSEERVLSFDSSPIRIGRHPGNELVFVEGFVSQWHAQIHFEGKEVSVVDLGSTNGTSVNGERIQAQTHMRMTSPDDSVQMGSIRITFGFSDAAQPAPHHQYVHPSPSGGHEVILRAKIDDGTGQPERILIFESSPIRLGRAKLNEIVFEQPFVSQFHALVRFEGTNISVMDLGSTNGTILNGQRLQPQTPMPLMSPNDIVQIGSISMKFEPDTQLERPLREPSFIATGPVDMDSEDTLHIFNPAEWLAELQGRPEMASAGTGNVRRSMKRIAMLVETFGRSYVELRDGFQQFGSEMGLKITTEQTPLNVANSPDQVLDYLLEPHASNHERVGELKRAFTDLALHQVALLNGVMAGVRELLVELSPEGQDASGGWSPFRGSKLAEMEKRRQALLEEDRFTRIVFGKAFARAYFAVTGQKSSE